MILERRYSPLIAIAISSAFFAAWHGPTQGFFWSKLLFFFLVGLVFGTVAYLTNSTLPAIPVHIAGDLLFFIAIWPQDAHRQLVSRGGGDVWFWISMGQVAVFGLLAVLALRILAARRPARPAQVTAAATPGQPAVHRSPSAAVLQVVGIDSRKNPLDTGRIRFIVVQAELVSRLSRGWVDREEEL